jgi:hypothetical protein
VPFAFQARPGKNAVSSIKRHSNHGTWLVLIAVISSLDGCTTHISLNSGGEPAVKSTALPVITSASSASILEGVAFSYQITATNNPTTYSAVGLPSGLSLDPTTGLISGTPITLGQYTATVLLSAENASGQGSANLDLATSNAAGSNCDSGTAAPAAAQSAGFNDLVFCDDFNSTSTIDVNGSGSSGYNWYTNLPFGWGQTQASAYSVSDSVLTVTSTGSTANWGLSTMDPKTGNGHTWIFGYMEARISFDPTLGPQSTGFPAVWAFSAHHVRSNNTDIWPEMDIFEANTPKNESYSGDFWGTLHQWQNSSTINYQSSNNRQSTNVDWSQWHTVASLWVQGQVTWYLDGVPLMTQQYSSQAPPSPLANTTNGINPTPAGVFNILDTQNPGMELILGSGSGWPLKVDWVRVWQQ